MKDRIEAKVLEFSGKLSTQIHLLAPVSYTHLDGLFLSKGRVV